MITKEDINSDWSGQDIALFVGVVAAVGDAIRATVISHHRGSDAVLPLVSKAAFVAIKGLMLQSGLSEEKSFIPAFNRWVELLKEETAAAPECCRRLESSMTFHGNA